MKKNRRQIGIRYKTFPILLVLMILAGCSRETVASPTVDEGEAITQVSKTAMEIPTKTPVPTDTSPPPTNTPEPTDTPLPPTRTHVPTNTQGPTATSIPTPDLRAMINWKELGLPGVFEAFSPEAMGIQAGAIAFDLSYGGKYKKYIISGSFVFANGEDPDTWIYGYTISLPINEDREIFDQIIDDIENFSGPGFTALESTEGVGNKSKGATGDAGDDKMDKIAFRLRNIGAFVFLRHDSTVDPGIDIKNVAQVYAESIERPTSYCSITSVRVVPGADNPTFEIQAEGFYPQEGRYISLEGEIELQGETITFVAGKLGGTGETVDPDGSLSEVIGIDVKQQLAAKGYKDVQLPEEPIEFTLTVGGHFSQCEATQTVTWP